MSRETFISYKYSEARKLRDNIISALGKDAQYYRGEDGFTDDMSSLKASTIKKKLSDMIRGTSVTIVIISPNMKDSKWIPWELQYSLYVENTSNGKSQMNGIVGVIQKVNGTYDWFQNINYDSAKGMNIVTYNKQYMPDIINENIHNSNPDVHPCNNCNAKNTRICKDCNTYDFWNGSYITLVEEDSFLNNPSVYIENAYEKSHQDSFIIKKQA